MSIHGSLERGVLGKMEMKDVVMQSPVDGEDKVLEVPADYTTEQVQEYAQGLDIFKEEVVAPPEPTAQEIALKEANDTLSSFGPAEVGRKLGLNIPDVDPVELAKTIGELFSPKADIEDMIKGSAETMEAFKSGDIKKIALGIGTMAAGMAGTMIPGSQVVKKGTSKVTDSVNSGITPPKEVNKVESTLSTELKQVKQDHPDVLTKEDGEPLLLFRNIRNREALTRTGNQVGFVSFSPDPKVAAQYGAVEMQGVAKVNKLFDYKNPEHIEDLISYKVNKNEEALSNMEKGFNPNGTPNQTHELSYWVDELGWEEEAAKAQVASYKEIAAQQAGELVRNVETLKKGQFGRTRLEQGSWIEIESNMTNLQQLGYDAFKVFENLRGEFPADNIMLMKMDQFIPVGAK